MPPPNFPIVDAHFHQWDPATTPREVSFLTRSLGRFPRLYKAVGRLIFPPTPRAFVGVADLILQPYLPPDHARSCQGLGIDTLVHVQAGWHAGGVLGPVGETRWLETLDFGPHQRLAAIVAHANLMHPKVADALSAHRQASAKVRGIRQMAAHHPARGVMKWTRHPHLLQQQDFLRGFEQLARADLSFDAWVYSHQLDDVSALARRFSQTSIVLDHLGTPVGAGGPYAGVGTTERDRAEIRARWRDDLARVAEQPNVHVKLSGLTMPILGFDFHRRAQPPSVEELCEALSPFVEHGLRCFGVDRCIWASNFPMDSVSAPLSRIFDAYWQLVERSVTPDNATASTPLRAIFRDNALRVYRVAD